MKREDLQTRIYLLVDMVSVLSSSICRNWRAFGIAADLGLFHVPPDNCMAFVLGVVPRHSELGTHGQIIAVGLLETRSNKAVGVKICTYFFIFFPLAALGLESAVLLIA